MKYKCVFFDLDHTLWDYEANSRDTLQELYDIHQLARNGIARFDAFHAVFKQVNQELWNLYDRGLIDSAVIRKERFRKIFDSFNVDNPDLALQLSQDYIRESPKKGKLITGAEEVLQYLARNYTLTIITNGFDEVQHTKIASARLAPFFHHIITSDRAGCKKPARGIFDVALSVNKVAASEAIMVGDNLLTDIAGARNASLDSVFFNPNGLKHEADVAYEISNLTELCSLL
jgi:putative hydrolase of the HAD superfamily